MTKMNLVNRLMMYLMATFKVFNMTQNHKYKIRNRRKRNMQSLIQRKWKSIYNKFMRQENKLKSKNSSESEMPNKKEKIEKSKGIRINKKNSNPGS